MRMRMRRVEAGLRRAVLCLAAASAGLLACSNERDAIPLGPGPGPDPGPAPTLALELALVSDAFDTPVFVTAPPGDTQRLFVVEQPGTIRVVKNGSLLDTPFLDLRGQVASGQEQGLLGLAFDPGYSSNGRFYVFYVDLQGDEKIARYQVSSNPDVAATSGEVLLTVDDVHQYHNGGMLAFGPDGMLWASVGDGGGGEDAYGFGQTRTDLMGSLLRIDVSGAGAYTIPSDNPFVPPNAPEIWNYGLRNPWRFSFDRANGDLYIADVGQDAAEEINVATALGGRGKGANYGWSIMEGAECFRTTGCDPAGLALPLLTYRHGDGCAVVGGYVYRGQAMPDLRGTYLYGDYCEGWVRSFRLSGGQAVQRQEWPSLATGSPIMSFGEDGRGELYLCTENGSLYRVVRSHPA